MNVADALRADPDLSDREIARRLHVGRGAVGNIRRQLTEAGDLTTAASHESPLTQLGDLLRAARRRGEPFATAWPQALQALHYPHAPDDAAQYRNALRATIDGWHDAYDRRPPTDTHAAAGNLTGLGLGA